MYHMIDLLIVYCLSGYSILYRNYKVLLFFFFYDFVWEQCT